jgi:tetratricopeptide (TPR) repeat protein
MSARRGFGDETWRLAVARDAEGLHRAAELLLQGDPGELNYDGHRARAFAYAVEGRTVEALEQLNEGWTEEWPFPAAYAADIARVRFLLGDYGKALEALQLSIRGADRIEPAVKELTPELVRHDRRLWTRALRIAVAGGTPWQRVSAAAAVIGARF